VLSTQRDTFLGGEDFTSASSITVVAEFKKEQGADLSKDVLALQRLEGRAEKGQYRAVAATQTEINLPYITSDASGPKHLNIKLTPLQARSPGRGI